MAVRQAPPDTSAEVGATAVYAQSSRAKRRKTKAAWLAWSLWTLAIGFAILSQLLAGLNRPADLLIVLLFLPLFLLFPTVGALIASRQPGSSIGWLFCAQGLAFGLGSFAEEYANLALIGSPGSLPGGELAAWVSSIVTGPALIVPFIFLFLLFPNGKVLSQRWRPVVWLAAATMLLLLLLSAFMPGPTSNVPSVENPFGIAALNDMGPLIFTAIFLLMLALLVASPVSMILRLRRAHGEERQQLKWFVSSSVLVGITLLAGPFLWANPDIPSDLWTAIFFLAVTTVPISVGIAILKYRLYEIDILINRTFVYVPLTGILAGLYSAAVALFQRLFQALTGETSDAAIVISTLILASLFTPLKNALQSFVDKRFKEAPHHTKELKAFGEQVRLIGQVVDLDARQVSRKLLDKSVSAFQAQGGAIYLGKDGQLELVHTSGTWNGREGGENEASNGVKDDGMNVYLESDGEQLGLLSLGVHENGRGYTKHDHEVLQQVADQVAQVIREDVPHSQTSSA